MSAWNEGDWIAVISLIVLAAFLAVGSSIAASRKDEAFGQPRGLYMLFFAEMWERFSYYGMRGLLVFYLTKHWLFADDKANLIYGAYTSLVFITPVLGGYLADRYLGQRKAVVFGGILIALGHFTLVVEGKGGQLDPTINLFWLALALIIVGTGFLKANISVLVGQLYPRTDIRRDGAYTIFYMGINVGAALGSILVGYLGETVGWGYGFGLAGIGMVAGLIVFVTGKGALRGAGEAPDPARLRERVAGLPLETLLYVIGIASVAVAWGLIQYQGVIQTLLIISGIGLLAYVLFEASKMPREPRERMFAILFLIALNPLFWGLFEQAGGSFNLYTDKFVDRGGVPASLFQSINSIWIMIMAPVLAWLWLALGKRGLEPSAPAKFGLALLQLGLGFLLFVWGATSTGMATMTPVFFVFLLYFLHTTGELCLSPVGLSAMNRLAPRTLASLIMGAWFYMTAVGNFVAGKIGAATGGESGAMDKATTLAIYNRIGWIAIGVGIAVVAISPLVKRLMHLGTLTDDDDLAGRPELGEPQAAGTNLRGETA